jgi:methylase of polypeptide subunit release factors
VLNSISIPDAGRLREFLLQSGYAEVSLREKHYFTELPSTRLRNIPRLLDRTQDANCLNTLLRWFWLGVPQNATEAAAFVPAWFIDLALSCGLICRDGDRLVSEAMLFPVDDFLVASDHTIRIDAQYPEFVLWPNPTSKLLSRFTVRRPSRSTLDLGTGNGIQALSAAAHSERVYATDLNPRAVAFASFTARLNGVENIECLTGDGFEPVSGRKFDLIVSNPPFFISPSGRYLFCDNPMDLDQLCRRFVREAPGFLNEDGYFQLLCEWAEVEGQPWRERVAEWLEGSGCDAWVLKGHTQDPSEYAQHRIAETAASPERDSELYASYMAYYRERKVEAIHDGIIAMHRRSGHNWTLIEEVTETPKDPFGESVLLTFSARDFLASHAADDQMMVLKPKLSPHCRLEQFFQPGDGGWQPTSLTLRLTKGFPFFIGLQAPVAGFLSGCNGTRTVADLIQDFARQVDAPLERVQAECLGILRRLIERGFLLP